MEKYADSLARLGRALRRVPLQAWRRATGGLASRIVAAAFAATLVTSLAVTLLSARSTESFLHGKINEKFPAILRSAAERLELGYSQRQLEVETFARSETLVQSFGRPRAVAATAGEEARIYLSYVLERFPQFEALFVLDAEGRELAWAGAHFALPEELRLRLAEVTESGVSDVERLEDRGIQVASAPVRDGRGRRRATLHAVVDTRSLEQMLTTEDLGHSGGIYVVGSDGRTLMRSPGAAPRARYDGPAPAPEGPAVVAQYQDGAGERVIGGAIAFPRFAWTLTVQEAYSEAFAPVVALVGGMLRVHLLIVLLFGAVGFQMARSIVRPIVAISSVARRIAAGESGVAIPVSERGDEIGVLTRAIHEMTQRLHSNQVELEERRQEIEEANQRLATHNVQLRQMNEVLEQLSITDELTRLHNHRFFQDHLPREIKRCERTGESLSLLLIDIDDFKKLNDRYGHAAGDMVLRHAAEVMNDVVRDMDLLARYGGEEFALLASQTDLPGAMNVAEKLRSAIEEARFQVEDRENTVELGITVSVGVALFKGDHKAFFTDADEALYRAKGSGKNCVVAAAGDSTLAKK